MADLSETGVLSQIPCGIMVLDPSRQILYVNEIMAELTGRPVAALKGQGISAAGIGGEGKNRAAIFEKDWWQWAEGVTIQQRAFVESPAQGRIPILLKGKRGRDHLGEERFYLCVFDFSHLEDWAVSKEPEWTSRDHFHGLVGRTPQMQDLYQLIELASGTDVNVIIQGESGTGKELVASAIHHSSPRRNHPLVRVNCAALTETLLESELFGHVKGAFTGAYRDRTGTFEAAHEGTILLDEVGEISPAVQAKLLRVLQERVVVRVGDHREIPIDVRIVAATNKNLRALVTDGFFREDLFYRLNVFPLHLPALKERRPDIPLLCEHFLEKYRKETGKNIRTLSADAMRLFLGYCWPGNVRELENAIAHAFVLCRGQEVQVMDLPHDLRVTAVREGICAKKIAGIAPRFATVPSPHRKTGRRLPITLEELTAELRRNGGSRTATAQSLGISKVALWKKMKKMGISE